MAVSRASRNVRQAVEYATWVADPATQQGEFVRAGGQPAAVAAWEDPEANRITGGFFTATRATMDAAYLRPRFPGYPAFQTEAAGILQQAVLTTGATRPALDKINIAYRKALAA